MIVVPLINDTLCTEIEKDYKMHHAKPENIKYSDTLRCAYPAQELITDPRTFITQRKLRMQQEITRIESALDSYQKDSIAYKILKKHLNDLKGRI